MSTHTKLRRCIDELELHFLEVPSRSVNHERLADGDNTLLGTRNGTLQHEVVVFDDAVVGEATHRRNRLLRNIVLSRSVTLIFTRTDAVDLLVKLSTVVVTVCTVSRRSIRCTRLYKTGTHFDRHEQPRT